MIRHATVLVEKVGGQAEVAGICGVTRQAVWGWLNTNGIIPVEHLATIRAAARDRGIPRIDKRIDRYLDAMAGKRRRRNQKV